METKARQHKHQDPRTAQMYKEKHGDDGIVTKEPGVQLPNSPLTRSKTQLLQKWQEQMGQASVGDQTLSSFM